MREVKGRVASAQSSFAPAQFDSAQARARPWRGFTYDARARLEVAYEDEGVTSPVDPSSLLQGTVTRDQVQGLGAGKDAWAYAREEAGSTLSITNQRGGQRRFRVTQPRQLGYQLRGVAFDGASRAVAHDLDGRVKEVGGRSFRYDVFGRLARVEDGAAVVEANAYDGLGRLVARFDGAGAVKESYATDGAQLLAAYTGAGQLKWEAAWGSGIDNLLEYRDASGGRHLPLTDYRNSVVGSFSVGADALEATAEYTPEGRVTLRGADGVAQCQEVGTGITCALPGGMPFGFGSALRSADTGLVYLRNRWYSPQLGEFLSHDALGYPDAFNPYAYVGQDPINFGDPWGLREQNLAEQRRHIGEMLEDKVRRGLEGLDKSGDVAAGALGEVSGGTQVASRGKTGPVKGPGGGPVIRIPQGKRLSGPPDARFLEPVLEIPMRRGPLTGRPLGQDPGLEPSGVNPRLGARGVRGGAPAPGTPQPGGGSFVPTTNPLAPISYPPIRPWLNRAGQSYPVVTNPGTGKPIPNPGPGLKPVPVSQRVPWGPAERGAFIKEWYDRGLTTPPDGWARYDIHHIRPREYGGSNAFENLVPVLREVHQGTFNAWWRDY